MMTRFIPFSILNKNKVPAINDRQRHYPGQKNSHFDLATAYLRGG